MTNRNPILLIAAVISLAVGASAMAQGREQGPGGPRPDDRGRPGGDRDGRGRSSREFVPPANLFPAPGSEWSHPERRPPRDERRDPERDYALDEHVVALSDAVSMVQSRFNATAVKTDTVMEAGQLIYRIRLLSADRSRVWTVSVDARTGRIH